MAPLSSTETFTTALAPADILARAQEWFVKYKGQVVGDERERDRGEVGVAGQDAPARRRLHRRRRACPCGRGSP